MDLNICLDPKLDKKGGKIEKLSEYGKKLITFCEEYSLADIWRVRNPAELIFTRRENSRYGIIHSRLDFWLTSICLEYQINSLSIKPGNYSDHSIISLKLQLLETNTR